MFDSLTPSCEQLSAFAYLLLWCETSSLHVWCISVFSLLLLPWLLAVRGVGLPLHCLCRRKGDNRSCSRRCYGKSFGNTFKTFGVAFLSAELVLTVMWGEKWQLLMQLSKCLWSIFKTKGLDIPRRTAYRPSTFVPKCVGKARWTGLAPNVSGFWCTAVRLIEFH